MNRTPPQIRGDFHESSFEMRRAARAIIHIGMPKTGTSSIQDTYFRFQDPSFEYVDWTSGNHSGLFVLLFEDMDKVAHYHGFAARGAEFIRDLPGLRAKWCKRLKEQSADAVGKTLLFSAEAITAPQFVSANHRLAAIFGERSGRTDAIGYVRPPVGFMASAFQQNLKSGTLSTQADFPRYRSRFEQIDAAFGRENVTLRDFSRDRLIGGDVVRDFAETAGIAMPPEDQIVRSNESLSLEATALLYVQRKFGKGFVKGFNGAHKANKEFIAELAVIGTRKLAFSEVMMAPLLDQIADDVAWMEDRLGHPLSRTGSTSPDAISSLDDLVDIALQNFDKVLEVLGENSPKAGSATVGSLVRALGLLREKSYTKALSNPPGKAIIHMNKVGKRSLKMVMTTEKPTEEEMQMRRKLANILWHLDMGEAIPENSEERAEAFKAIKADYMLKALKLVRQLGNHKLSLVQTVENG